MRYYANNDILLLLLAKNHFHLSCIQADTAMINPLTLPLLWTVYNKSQYKSTSLLQCLVLSIVYITETLV